MIKVPFLDLGAQYLSIKDEIDDAIHDVLQTSKFILGEHVERFEGDVARYLSVKYAIAVGNGTQALHLALLACGIGASDKVLTAPNSFIATAEAISHSGATPAFCDVDVDGLLDLQDSSGVGMGAVIPVHLYGLPVNMQGLKSAFGSRVIVEDACQAFGATYHGKHIGTAGNLGCFSFYPGKVLGAYGDGGLVVTDDVLLAEKVRSLRSHGEIWKNAHLRIGYNYRLDALQCAILRVKLRHFDSWERRRAKIAEMYLGGLNVVSMPPSPRGRVWHQFVIRHPGRDTVREALFGQSIETGIHYPVPIHLQPAYASLGHHEGSFPVAESLSKTILSLPIYPEMSDEQVCAVIEAVNKAVGR